MDLKKLNEDLYDDEELKLVSQCNVGKARVDTYIAYIHYGATDAIIHLINDTLHNIYPIDIYPHTYARLVRLFGQDC